jgi:HD-like signal output (HDOD) protein
VSAGNDQAKILQLLLKIDELKELGDVALLDLAKTATIKSLPKGGSLSAEEQLSQRLYLIDGEVELSVSGKNMQLVVAGTQRTSTPLFRVHSHGLIAKCRSPVRLLCLSEEAFERHAATIRPKDSDGIELEVLSEAEQEASILHDIRHVFHHRDVDLPSLPEVALRINRAVSDDTQSLRNVVLEIQSDPMISARVIQVANSLLYKPETPLVTVHEAVSLIGHKVVQIIVRSVVLRNLFKPNSPILRQRAFTFYTHSIRVAAVCHILARHLHEFNPDQAFLAGLLHDIGVMPILILADKRADLNSHPELLEVVITNLSGFVGGLMLRQWGFSDEFKTIAEESQHWQRQRSTADYCHLVGGVSLDAPPMSEIAAFKRLRLDTVDPVSIINEARDEIHEIVNLLSHSSE